MIDHTGAVLLVIFILELKHFVFDYPVQRPYMFLNKGVYGHPGGILHAGIHALATTVVFLVITPPLIVGLGIVIAEFLIHYHVDWTKEQFLKRQAATAKDDRFWFALGLDQLLHHLTYVAIAAILWKTIAA